MKRITNLILSAFLILPVCAQPQDMKKKLENYFKSYRAYGQLIRTTSHLQEIRIDDTQKTIEVCADSHFGIPLTMVSLTSRIPLTISVERCLCGKSWALALVWYVSSPYRNLLLYFF